MEIRFQTISLEDLKNLPDQEPEPKPKKEPKEKGPNSAERQGGGKRNPQQQTPDVFTLIHWFDEGESRKGPEDPPYPPGTLMLWREADEKEREHPDDNCFAAQSRGIGNKSPRFDLLQKQKGKIMFLVAFGNDHGKEVRATKILKHCHTLKEAADAREASGDLVFYAGSREIVKDFSWLFDWERKDPKCYAQRKIAMGAELKLAKYAEASVLSPPR